MSLDLEIRNKNVLITGANHGIGAEIAKAFAEQKANIFITYFIEQSKYSKEVLEKALQKGIGSDELYVANQQKSPDEVISYCKEFGVKVDSLETDKSLRYPLPTMHKSDKDEIQIFDY